MGPKKEKRRRNKDPLRPKRPTSAYFYFAKFCRDELKAEGKSITRVGDFTKEVSAKWKVIGDKTPFEASAKIDKERFTAEMAVYKGNKGPKKKRAATAYFHFLAEFRKRPNIGSMHIKEISKEAGAAWRALTEEQKQPFVVKYEVQRKQIAEEEAANQAAEAAAARGAAAGGAAAEDEEEEYEDDDDEEEEDDE